MLQGQGSTGGRCGREGWKGSQGLWLKEGVGALPCQGPMKLEQGEDLGHLALFFPFPPAARAGRKNKCSEGRTEILAEAPA